MPTDWPTAAPQADECTWCGQKPHCGPCKATAAAIKAAQDECPHSPRCIKEWI